jgi:hypothetical protein
MQAKHSIRDAPIIVYEGERYYFAQKNLSTLSCKTWMNLIYLACQGKKRCFVGSPTALSVGNLGQNA